MKNNITGIWAVYDAYKSGSYKVDESLYYENGIHFTAIPTTNGPWAVYDALEDIFEE